ncbi:MAG: prolipoprotein diacylglyceryl transferase [Candidatus Abawacabacteria bacterium]|nr:prolipoprotein diacylglyceryl transferase [Candidatus Abawacabacteria bacterium]
MIELLLIDFPPISPIAFQWGTIAIHWYGIMYLLSFILIYIALSKSKLKLTQAEITDYIFYAALGVVIGGRLGYVLFYNLGYYYHNPLEVIALWQGGMSFHGGFIGVVAATYLFCRNYKITFSGLADYVVMFVPFTLALGRIGNFINAELYGRLSTLPWAIQFPTASGYRHPAQLYEALLHIIVGILLLRIHRFTAKPWLRTALFLLFYSIIRIVVECFREPDRQIGLIGGIITMGQILTFPILVFAIVWILQLSRKTDGRG